MLLKVNYFINIVCLFACASVEWINRRNNLL